jgi:hypothetical protein
MRFRMRSSWKGEDLSSWIDDFLLGLDQRTLPGSAFRGSAGVASMRPLAFRSRSKRSRMRLYSTYGI